MKKKKQSLKRSQTSWQEIRQTANRKLITAYARRRLLGFLFRSLAGIAVMVGVAVGVYAAVQHWNEGLNRVSRFLPEQPLKEIRLQTDGVLTPEWLRGVLELPADPDMLAIDIRRIKARIEAHGQVRSAIVRRLPERLLVSIRERNPVARLAVRDEQGEVKVMLVDRHGFVYQGFHYDRHELAGLPFLDGIELHQVDGQFLPLPGMDRVEDLFETAREHVPHIYRTWRVADCRDLPNLLVRADDGREVVFGPDRYVEQLRWLDLILTSNRQQLVSRRERVDLSLGGNGVVVR